MHIFIILFGYYIRYYDDFIVYDMKQVSDMIEPAKELINAIAKLL